MLPPLLLLCWTLLVTGQGQPPPSPCPEVFRYVFDRGQWSGRVLVPVPAAAKRMVVVASLFVVDVELPPEHPGALRLVQDTPTVVQQVQSRKMEAVDYVLEFPTQYPLPLVDKIKVNRKVICQGAPVRSKVRTKVTFTNRLNGLRPPSTRPGQLPDLEQGHNLDLVDEGRQMPPKNGGLELLDNEVVEVEAHEAEMMSNPKDPDQDLNAARDGSAEDEDRLHPDDDAELLENMIPEEKKPDDKPYPPDGEDVPENEFDLDNIDDDVELLDNEIPEANHPDVQFKPKYPNGGKDREDIPENEFDFGDDVELLDNEVPVQYKPKHKDRYPGDVKKKENVLKTEFDLVDDVEMLDDEILVEQIEPEHKNHGNDREREDIPESKLELDGDGLELMDSEIPEADSPEVQSIPKHKSQGSNFKTGFISKKGQKENPGKEFEDVLDNEVLQADSIDVLNIPNHKSQESNFNKEFYVPMNEADLSGKVNPYRGVELLDDNMDLESNLEYDEDFSDNDLTG